MAERDSASDRRAGFLWTVALIGTLAITVVTVHLGPNVSREWRGGILAASAFIGAASAAGLWALRAILARINPDGDIEDLDTGLAISIVIAIPTIMFGVIAFASATRYLLDGHVGDITSPSYDIWSLELYYTWSLLEAVPLLDITGTLDWAAPVAISGQLAGVLTLMFKAIEILPLLGALTAIAKLIQDIKLRTQRGSNLSGIGGGWLGFNESLADGFRWWHPLYFLYYLLYRTVAILLFLIPQLLRPALAGLVLIFLVSRSSPLFAALPWLDHGAVRFTIALLLASVCALQVWIRYSLPVALVYDGSIGQGVAIFLSRLIGLIMACIAVTGLTVVLVESGTASFESPVDQDGQTSAVVEWYMWNVADAVPVLEIPKALDWSLGTALVDSWSRSMLLLVKVFAVSLVIVPVQLLIRIYTDNLAEQAVEAPNSE